jgi:molybdenum cofactor synthesis domain-containing protein
VGAAILTIGNEIVSGDVPNTNAAWLAQRFERLGVHVDLMAAVPDRLELIADLVRREAPRADVMVVTGGLGGTPDDITRESIAAAFDVPQVEVAELAAELRGRFAADADCAARWALLPSGARPLANPLGGAPGFAIANVYVLPGLPEEMEAMFLTLEDELRRDSPIAAWRRTYRTTESRIAHVLEAIVERHPLVVVGSYPRFTPEWEVEVVVKCADAAALAAASAWLETALEDLVGR